MVALLVSVVMSEIITCIMGLILRGTITLDYVLTALVASFMVAGSVVALLIAFFKRLREDARNLNEVSESLIKTEERARQALTASHSALWDIDLTTGQVYLSDGWSPFLCGEVRPTYTTYLELSGLVPAEEHPMLRAALVDAVKGKNDSLYKVVHRVRKLDGNYIWVQSEGQVTARDKNGWALRMTGINRDITELKAAEDKIKAQFEEISQVNARLLEANHKLAQAQNQLLQSEKMAFIGQLAAGVAHEINNPIGYVNSNFGTLKKYLSDILAMLDKYESVLSLAQCSEMELDDLRELKRRIRLEYLRKDARALIEESQEGLDRVKKIVQDLKDFAHTGAEDQWAWADVQQVLESTLNIVWNELKYKCEVRKEYSPLPKVYCLPSRLNQAFMNLLVNAAQAIEERGVVVIRTGHEGDQVWLEVADSGMGIETKYLSRIFDPFFTTKPVGKGTGLGLSVSFSIVEKHHGRIEVQSEVGKGSVFRIWLPIEPAHGKERHGANERGAMLANR
ncbi:MAG TPA: ATP-binding protein [Gallionellaceae bacterium]|nr:ATP-binding protein [Gallionellaceae bacterium]